MATLAQRLSDLITAIGADIKSLQTQVSGLSAGSGANVQTTMVTLDQFGNGTVTDALVTTNSLIMVTTGRALPTDVNDPDMDPVIWSVSTVAAGSFTVHGESKTPIRGPFRINYARSG